MPRRCLAEYVRGFPARPLCSGKAVGCGHLTLCHGCGPNLAGGAEKCAPTNSIFSLSLLSGRFFLSLAINLLSANMSSNSRYPHLASSMQSGSDAYLNRNPEISSTTPSNSHFHDLRQLEPEENLIELGSGPPTPQTQNEYFDVPTHQQGESLQAFSHRIDRYQAQ